MSDTQSNFELNRIDDEVKQMGLIKNTQNIFVLVLVYTVMITAMLSALLGGVVMQVYYGIEFIFNMIPRVYNAFSKFYEASFDYENTYTNNEEPPVKKPLIDETWCNVSVKNIINYEDEEVVSEAEAEVVSEAEDLDEAESEEEAVSEAEDETVSLEDIRAEVEEEILSLKKIEDLRAEEILN